MGTTKGSLKERAAAMVVMGEQQLKMAPNNMIFAMRGWTGSRERWMLHIVNTIDKVKRETGWERDTH